MSDSRSRTVLERIDLLGAISEETGRLTRSFASDAMRRVNAAVGDWMDAAGLEVRQDAIGNLIGRYPAAQAGARSLLLGSHLDTVRDAGKFDGPLGVLVALAAVERLAVERLRLPFFLEILGFADEEGLRYQTTYLGSRVVAGTLDPAVLGLLDAGGVSMADAIRAFGGDPVCLAGEKRVRDAILGYCEVHIEQGPVLEAAGLPLGVVSAIVGQTRIAATLTGEAGHAGTLPMAARRDALCAAAELALAVESLARRTDGLVATVGRLSVEPGASNVVPGRAELSVDLRHADDGVRRAAAGMLRSRAGELAAERGVSLDWRVLQDSRAVACEPALSSLLARAIEETGHQVMYLPSAAGHDAAALADLTRVAMLFVRCRAGASHNPAEAVDERDVEWAITALDRFLDLVAREMR